MFSNDSKSLREKILLIVIAVLLLAFAAWALIYFFVLDQVVRDQAATIGNLQSRVQNLEEQERNDQQDINDLYDQVNGTGADTSGEGNPTGGVAPAPQPMPGTHA